MALGRWTPAREWPVLEPQGRWTPPSWWPVSAATPRGDPRARAPGSPPFQVGARRFATDARRLLNLPQGPAQSAEGAYLLLFLVVQDVAHACVGTSVPRRRQRLGRQHRVTGSRRPPGFCQGLLHLAKPGCRGPTHPVVGPASGHREHRRPPRGAPTAVPPPLHEHRHRASRRARRLHGTLSGPATRKLCARVALATAGSNAWPASPTATATTCGTRPRSTAPGTTSTRTRPVQVAIGERRRPGAANSRTTGKDAPSVAPNGASPRLEPHTDDNQALAARVAGRLGTVPYEGTDQISAEMRVGCRDGDV